MKQSIDLLVVIRSPNSLKDHMKSILDEFLEKFDSFIISITS